MHIEPGPHALEQTRFVLGPDGRGTLKEDSPDFYAELDREHDGFRGCALVAEYRFETPWGGWEMHPEGDEVVYLVSGDVDFVLWVDDAERIVRVQQPGSYVVVPSGTWHTARPHAPTVMLFITPGRNTQHAPSPR